MINQKDIISVESYDEALGRYNKSEYVVLSRDEYNLVTKKSLACKVIYSTDVKPFFIPIIVNGLRRNSKIDTLSIYTIREGITDESHTVLGQVSDKEFLQVSQAVSLNFNFPLL